MCLREILRVFLISQQNAHSYCLHSCALNVMRFSLDFVFYSVLSARYSPTHLHASVSILLFGCMFVHVLCMHPIFEQTDKRARAKFIGWQISQETFRDFDDNVLGIHFTFLYCAMQNRCCQNHFFSLSLICIRAYNERCSSRLYP